MASPGHVGAQFKNYVTCDNCNDHQHEATYHHDSEHGQGPIYEVTCDKDNLADYYTSERLEKQAPKKRKPKTAKSLGLL